MTEQPRNKVSELTYDLVHGSLSQSERARRGLLLPELRLRSDTPAIEIDGTTQVVGALTSLGAEPSGTLALRESSGEPRALVISVERYLQLAGQEVRNAQRVSTTDGRLVPEEAAFTRTHVEQVDSRDSWGSQASDVTA